MGDSLGDERALPVQRGHANVYHASLPSTQLGTSRKKKIREIKVTDIDNLLDVGGRNLSLLKDGKAVERY